MPAMLRLTLSHCAGGVVLASLKETSFTWFGFLTAMGSNVTFQSRNVLSKKLMLTKVVACQCSRKRIFSPLVCVLQRGAACAAHPRRSLAAWRLWGP
jgi:hypothetical protein